MDNEFITHYNLVNDNDHFVDAECHNEYERYIIRQIRQLDSCIKIEVTSKEKGSLKDYYRISFEDTKNIQLSKIKLLAFFDVWFSEQEDAIDIAKAKEAKQKIDKEIFTKDDVKDYLINNRQFRVDKSAYYKAMDKDTKIKSVSIGTNSIFDSPISYKVDKPSFTKMILSDISRKVTREIETVIYVISPVLIQGSRNVWYGICQHEGIKFKIEDKNFLNQVYNHEVKFGSGTALNCKVKLNEEYMEGKLEPKISRTVTLVKTWYDDENYQTETKRFKKIKSEEKQLNLFDDSQW